MNIYRLTLRNIVRRRGRFAFTLLGITVGIASLVTFLSLGGGLKNEIRREASALGANLIVTPKGSCAYEQVSILTGEPLPVTITADEVAAIQAIPGLTAVPLITEKTAIANRPVPVSGIDPEPMRQFKGWQMAEGEFFSAADRGVLAGRDIADEAGLTVGSQVTVRGERLPVVGILAETGSRDDGILYLPLPLAQELFKAGDRVSYLVVKVDDMAKADSYILQIKEAANVGVVSDDQLRQSVLSIVGTVNVTMQLVAAVAVLAAAFGIVNTMLTAAYERRREIGILQALGARQGTIFSLFLLESGFYGLLGGAAGAVAGLAAAVLAAPLISQNAFTAFVRGSDRSAAVDPLLLAGAIVFSFLVALAAGLYPAWRASRLSPVEAISYE